MVIQIILGMMNLLVMAGIALVIAIEKMVPRGRVTAQLVGVIAAAAGIIFCYVLICYSRGVKVGHVFLPLVVIMAMSSRMHTGQGSSGNGAVAEERQDRQAMQPFVDRGELSGAVTLVADDKSILHFSAMGQRNLAKQLPMRTDTIFWVASMTKPMTSTAIMMLQEEGKALD